MVFDFSKLGSAKSKKAPTDPIKIFESLPSLKGTPNDLWRGQDRALSGWNDVRTKNDVLISLNTGAGKTIVGLLVAQSLVNEGVDNVIYVCSTIDLVNQTANEADRIGIDHTTRVSSSYSNELFETGKAFCITTYSALFNGHSSIRRRYFPGAIIFDDAHVAEATLRSAFTIRIDIRDQEDLFGEIAELFEPHFRELGIRSRFRESLSLGHHSTAFVAPGGLYERSERLLEIFNRHKLGEHAVMKYPFAWLEDNLDACAALFTRGVFEISPPFLPSLALDIFEQPLRRVYLSATLQSQTEFVRAFGRLPKATVMPSNDAGNGERLIINGRRVEKGLGTDFVSKLVGTRKVVIAIPDYSAATKWEGVAKPPNTEDFSKALAQFRKAKDGAFALVSRVDGIDLPHETCRIMVVDGLPAGMSLIERFQWEYLRMKNVHAVRVANRLAQLFGRINRGRNDYGAFLLEGEDVNKWLDNDRNLSLLPPLLQKQVHVGREVHDSGQLKSQKDVIALVDSVLGRDKGWLDYYEREVKLGELDKDQLARAEAAEPFLVEAALAEARYAAAMWSGDPAMARRELEKSVDQTATHDTPLGGWHALWLGAAYEREGDRDAALREYAISMKRLGRSITLPRALVQPVKNGGQELNEFGKSIWDLLSHSAGAKYEKELAKFTKQLAFIDGGTPNQAEAGMRALGELLGFTSTRPDNDEGIGPDVLWRDEKNAQMVALELKTDKDAPGAYSKDDIGQGHNHIEWLEKNHSAFDLLGLLFVGPDGAASDKASPSKQMGLCRTASAVALRDGILALVEEMRRKTPMERFIAISTETGRDFWSLEKIFERLHDKAL